MERQGNKHNQPNERVVWQEGGREFEGQTAAVGTSAISSYAAIQRARVNVQALTPADVRVLQRTIGNQAVQRLLLQRAGIEAERRSSGGMRVVQARLTVGAANDVYEQEADRVASHVVEATSTPKAPPVQRHPEHAEEEEVRAKFLPGAKHGLVQRHYPHGRAHGATPNEDVRAKFLPPAKSSLVQRHPEHAEEEEVRAKFLPGAAAQIVRRKANGGFEIGSALSARLLRQKGRGQPMPDLLRRSMESSFGADFKDVRLHTGTESVQMSRELSAEAFTHGRDIFFGAGRFNPGSRAGKQLLTHELTHVVQQNPDVTSNVQTKRDKGIQVPIKRMDAAQVQRKGFWNAFGKGAKQTGIISLQALAAIGGALGGFLGGALGSIGGGTILGGKMGWDKGGNTVTKLLLAAGGGTVGLLAGILGTLPASILGTIVGGAHGWEAGDVGGDVEKKERELAQKYGVNFGGKNGKHFDMTILKEVEKALSSLPEGNVGGTYMRSLPQGKVGGTYVSGGRGIHPSSGTGNLASFYGHELGDEHQSLDQRLKTEIETAGINVGSPWWLPKRWHAKMRIGTKTLGLLDSDQVAVLMDALSLGKRTPKTGDKSIFRGVGDVHKGRQLLPYTVRHEMGHAIDHRIKFTATRGRLKHFGGWITHARLKGVGRDSPHDDPGVRKVGEHFLGVAGLTNGTLYNTKQQYTTTLVDVFISLSSGMSVEESFADLVIPGPNPMNNLEGSRPIDAGMMQKIEKAAAAIEKARNSPWLLEDGGGSDIEYNGRRMHVDHYGSWVSYNANARDQHGVSNYQFSSPGEWFAEAYAVFYEGDPKIGKRGRDRLDEPIKDWFRKNLGPEPGADGERGRLVEGDKDSGYKLKELAHVSPELMSYLNVEGPNPGQDMPDDLKLI